MYKNVQFFGPALLEWYDRERRVLPWRALPGERPEPYRVWLSEIMLQQTTVAAVIPYFLKFVERWPTVETLAAAPLDEVLKAWAGLGYYARARNLHRCAQTVADRMGSLFPHDPTDLRTLPGVGEYTAGAIAAIAFNYPALALDGNGERVLARYFDIAEPFPAGKKTVRTAARPLFEGHQDGRAGDRVQALMDLGATLCTPRNPRCGLCPLAPACRARAAGHAQARPVRRRPPAKPRRQGFVYLICDEVGRILVERRPSSGLLGGMTGLPTSDWTEGEPEHPLWLTSQGHRSFSFSGALVSHGFTHFDLTLKGVIVRIDSARGEYPSGMSWISVSDDPGAAMPTVFRKALQGFKQES